MMQYNLEEYIHRNIPISKDLGVRQVEVSNSRVILQGCYSSNINHKSTVFGGSLQTLCVLSCWSIIHLNLQNVAGDYEIVICDSQTRYSMAIKEDFQSVSELDTASSEWLHFLQKLKRKGRAKIAVSATIFHNDQLAVKFEGTFACLKQP